VVDVATSQARRVLDGDPRTQPEPGVVPVVDGHELRRPDHRIPSFAADGIALDAKGEWLYWQALVGRTLYRAPTSALLDAGADVGAAVEKVGTTNVADGLWMGRPGLLVRHGPEDQRGADALAGWDNDGGGAGRAAALAGQLGGGRGRVDLCHGVAYPGHGAVPREGQHATGQMGTVPDCPAAWAVRAGRLSGGGSVGLVVDPCAWLTACAKSRLGGVTCGLERRMIEGRV